MKTIFSKSLLLMIAWTGMALAQDDVPTSATSGADAKSAAAKDDDGVKKKADDGKKELSQEELEAKFIATLTNATMAGRWCLIMDGKLTPEKEDRYEIKGVTKTVNGSWLIRSRIQYGKFDMVLPVPVKVEWAGDTPVIIVDNMGIPGGNLYSARVVIYDDSYAGTWSGGGGKVRGLMNGMITREEEEAAPAEDKKSESTEASKKE